MCVARRTTTGWRSSSARPHDVGLAHLRRLIAGDPAVFHNRQDAGERLAAALLPYRTADTLVLGIPRGGVPVAAGIAGALGAELDVAIARKLGVPREPELAMGAVTATGRLYLDRGIIARRAGWAARNRQTPADRCGCRRLPCHPGVVRIHHHCTIVVDAPSACRPHHGSIRSEPTCTDRGDQVQSARVCGCGAGEGRELNGSAAVDLNSRSRILSNSSPSPSLTDVSGAWPDAGGRTVQRRSPSW